MIHYKKDYKHLCCAIADKKYQDGVAGKKAQLLDRIVEDYVFRQGEIISEPATGNLGILDFVLE